MKTHFLPHWVLIILGKPPAAEVGPSGTIAIPFRLMICTFDQVGYFDAQKSS